VVQLEPESADGREQVLKLIEHCRIDGAGWHEREEHRDVGRDAEWRVGIEAFPVLRHDRVGRGDLDEQAATGTSSAGISK
jgi:hypothetical protein